jgi:hypothetical protein
MDDVAEYAKGSGRLKRVGRFYQSVSDVTT